MKAFAVAAALALLTQARPGRPAQGPGAAEGTPAPDFALKTRDGKETVRLSELKGKPVVLVFGSYT